MPSRPAAAPSRRRLAAAALIGAVVLAPIGAIARPSAGDAAAFASRELTRLCDDPTASRLRGVDDRRAERRCAARVAAGRLALEFRFRPRAGGDARTGAIDTLVRFDRGARFFCAVHSEGGFVGLYVDCGRATRTTAEACVRRTEVVWRDGRRDRARVHDRAIAKLLDLAPTDCRVVAEALGFVAARVAPRGDGALRDFFAR